MWICMTIPQDEYNRIDGWLAWEIIINIENNILLDIKKKNI